MSHCIGEEYRIGNLDIWVIPQFAHTVLDVDPAALQQRLEDNYPVRGKGDAIDWARPQWVEGDNDALHYRGRELKRGKMWFQCGEPQTDGFVKYYYVRSRPPTAPTYPHFSCRMSCH